jgi:hypothetical protein
VMAGRRFGGCCFASLPPDRLIEDPSDSTRTVDPAVSVLRWRSVFAWRNDYGIPRWVGRAAHCR